LAGVPRAPMRVKTLLMIGVVTGSTSSGQLSLVRAMSSRGSLSYDYLFRCSFNVVYLRKNMRVVKSPNHSFREMNALCKCTSFTCCEQNILIVIDRV